MRICPVCDCGDTREERVYMLPAALEALGYKGFQWAHVSCVTVDRNRVERTAKRRGVTPEMVVQARQSVVQ
jgi:hypothetical protein